MKGLKSVCVAVMIAFCGNGADADPRALKALNGLRADNGLPALTYAPRLEQAAFRHADDMLLHRHFSHTGSDGSTVAHRVTATGYRWCYVAENIAQGQRSLDEVMRAWAASPGHRTNMLSPRVSEFAVAQGPGYIWVMVLASRSC